MSPDTPAAAFPADSSAPSRALRGYAWGVLVYNIAAILWGTTVRATGSGAGCGDSWPLCNGSATVARIIEFTHRASSGIALIAVIVLAVWTWHGTVKRHLARAAAIASLIFIFIEALLGALLVLLGMTAQNDSPARAAYLSLHLTNTLLMLAALALTAHFLARKRGYMRGGVEIRGAWLASAGLIAVILTGVTGALAALADTLHPATNLWRALALDFSAHSSWMVRIRWAHPVMSLIAGLFLLEIILLGTRSKANHRLAAGLTGLLLLQYALGVADLTLLTPLFMQILHLLGADLLWITLVVLVARLCVRPVGCSAAAGCS
jgi:cytochrome c oxidase assembly protein subunit 15